MPRDMPAPLLRDDVLCPCLGLDDADIDRALDAGAETVGAIFRGLQAVPRCGDCVGAVKRRLRAHQALKLSTQSQRRKPMGHMTNATKAKVSIMMENGDKLEYEAHLDVGENLNAARDEATRRLADAVRALAGGGDLKADRIKIESA